MFPATKAINPNEMAALANHSRIIRYVLERGKEQWWYGEWKFSRRENAWFPECGWFYPSLNKLSNDAETGFPGILERSKEDSSRLGRDVFTVIFRDQKDLHDRMQSTCAHRYEMEFVGRPGNVIAVEVGKPLTRCLLKKRVEFDATKYIWSGGNAGSLLGYCYPANCTSFCGGS